MFKFFRLRKEDSNNRRKKKKGEGKDGEKRDGKKEGEETCKTKTNNKPASDSADFSCLVPNKKAKVRRKSEEEKQSAPSNKKTNN